MKPRLGWIDVKDYRALPDPAKNHPRHTIDEETLDQFVTVEEGDSGYRKILCDLLDYFPAMEARLKERGIEGVFVDMEPHLRSGGQFGGFSGPDGFGVALRSFCRVAEQVGWNCPLKDMNQLSR